MSFTVVWTPEVRDDFINQWLNADSKTRNRFTAIANAMDRYLASDPESCGTPHPADPESLICTLPGFTPKVSITFEVKAADRLVRVTGLYIY